MPDPVHVYVCPKHGERRCSILPEQTVRPCGFLFVVETGLDYCREPVVHEVHHTIPLPLPRVTSPPSP